MAGVLGLDGGRGEGRRGRTARGVDSPPQFQRRGPVGRGATAMVVAGRRPALAGAAAMLQSPAVAGAGGKGRGNLGDSIPLTTSG